MRPFLTSCSVIALTSGSPQQRRPRRRSRRPSGCCPCRGSPSSPRARARRRSRQTGRRSAYGPWYRSCRSWRDRRPCCRGEGAARAAAGGDGEILLALLDALLLIGAGDGMLEAGRVGGVAGDNQRKAHHLKNSSAHHRTA